MKPKVHFFIGKGGVGKSTTSALTAVHLSTMGCNTLLVSMDPAHNQRDIFDEDFSEKPRHLTQNLQVKEVDTDHWVDKYLKETQILLKRMYAYQSAFNLEDYFKVLQFSPGLEEYALLMAFEDILHSCEDTDVVIFDMAPTALSLRFFSLPSVTLTWLKTLLKLRTSIYEKKEIISKIKFGTLEIEQDKVKGKLESMISRYRHLGSHFHSDQTSIHLVMDDELLSFSESVRIKQKLETLDLRIGCVFVNKVKKHPLPERIEHAFRGRKKVILPYSETALLGIRELSRYLEANGSLFSQVA